MEIVIEKNLKRCLKRKVTFTLGMMVAFLITGSLGYAEMSNPITIVEGQREFTNIEINSSEFMPGSTKTKSGITLKNKDTIVNFNGDYLNVKLNDNIDKQVAGIAINNRATGIFNAKETVIDVKNTGASGMWGFGLIVESSGKAEFTGENVTINNYQQKYTSQTLTSSSAEILFNNTGDVNISSTSEYGVTGVDNKNKGSIIFNNKGNVNIYGEILPGDKIATTNVVGIQSQGESITEITGNVNDFNIVLKGAGVDSDGTTYSSGTKAVTIELGDKFLVDSNTFNIKMDIAKDLINTPPDGHTANRAYGLDSVGGTIKIGENTRTNIEINQGQGDVYAIYSKGSASTIDILGDTYIKANGAGESYALYAENSGSINIGGEDKTVQINGDIYSGRTDEENQIGSININLTGENSYINGSIFQESTSTVATLDENGTSTINGINIILKDGATWSNKGNSSLGSLTMENGIINNTVDGDINIGIFSGTGGIINTKTEVAADGSLNTGSINITTVTEESNPTFDIHFTGITADDITDISKVTTNGVIKAESDKIITTGRVDEGLLKGTLIVDSTGKVIQKESNTVLGLTNIGTINFLTWRQEISSLNQRMGELRDSQGTSGVWGRVYGGEFELDNRFKNEYQTYQVGCDKSYNYAGGKLFLGYLFSYTDGNTDYDLGSGDNNSFGVGLYGTWLNNTGHYVDVIAKVNRLHNEYDVYSSIGVQSKGDYTNYGVSLSTEYGKRFTMDRVFVEPSIRIDLGKVGHRSYTASSGVRVDQNSIYTAQGLLGAKLGYKLEKGNIYARLSGVKEFAGDIDMHYRSGNLTKTDSLDLEDEWIEFGIGGNYRVVENVNLYLDLSKTTESVVDTNWQANLGFRWEL